MEMTMGFLLDVRCVIEQGGDLRRRLVVGTLSEQDGALCRGEKRAGRSRQIIVDAPHRYSSMRGA